MPETSLETTLDDLDAGAVTPERIRELGEALPGGELPGDVAAALERHADADDPAVRLAVCRVCADVDDDRATDLLKRLRIDPNDRVANAAISGLQ